HARTVVLVVHSWQKSEVLLVAPSTRFRFCIVIRADLLPLQPLSRIGVGFSTTKNRIVNCLSVQSSRCQSVSSPLFITLYVCCRFTVQPTLVLFAINAAI